METLRGAVGRAPALGAAAGSGGSEGVGVGEGKFRGGGCAPAVSGEERGEAARADPAAPCPQLSAVQPVGPRCRFPAERCLRPFPAAALFSPFYPERTLARPRDVSSLASVGVLREISRCD